MNYYPCTSQKDISYLPPMLFEFNNVSVGTDGQTVAKAYKDFLEYFFVPISREVIPIFRFSRLKEKWKSETAFLSSISEIAMHPDYQQIIGMGTTAIPFILQEMTEKPGQWFWALKSITAEDPVLPENRGNVKAMTQSWIKWGKEQGYIY